MDSVLSAENFPLTFRTEERRMQKLFALRHLSSIKNDPVTARAALEGGQADRDMPLSKRGELEAGLLQAAIGPYLKKRGLTAPVHIIHSPYRRTRITADYLVDSFIDTGIKVAEVTADERLRDHDSGLVLGLSHDEARRLYPEYARAMDAHPRAYLEAIPPGGESKRTAIARTRELFEEVTRSEEDVVLVTHFDQIVYMSAFAEGLEGEAFDDRVLGVLSSTELWNSTGSVTEWTRESGSFVPGNAFRKLW